MATQPDNRRAEEAAALALLLVSRRYNLPALIRQQKIRARPFRRIKPTEALRANMAAPFFAIVRGWLEQKPALLAAYVSARATGDAAAMQRAVDQAEIAARQALIAAPTRIQSALGTLERWHRGQWVNNIRSSTRLDVSFLTSPQDVQAEAASAAAWSGQLARSLHEETHAKVALGLMAALAGAALPSDAGTSIAEVLQKARRRAAGIGVDQLDKASAGMTRARILSAGLISWMWQHNTELHYRPEHKARNGRIYNQSDAPNDMPGVLPFCRCAQIPLFE